MATGKSGNTAAAPPALTPAFAEKNRAVSPFLKLSVAMTPLSGAPMTGALTVRTTETRCRPGCPIVARLQIDTGYRNRALLPADRKVPAISVVWQNRFIAEKAAAAIANVYPSPPAGRDNRSGQDHVIAEATELS